MNMSKRKRNQLLIVSFVQFVLVGAEFWRKVPFSNSFIFSSINVDLNGASSTFFIKKIKHLNLINIFLHRNNKTKFPFCYSKVLISCNTVAYINM